MNDKRAADRKQRRADKEAERERRDRRAKKLVSRKLAHEVKEVEEWNNQRLMFARRIDGEFKKGMFPQKNDYIYVVLIYLKIKQN